MQKAKICMVGDFAVGKTSLTQRFVNNCFSEKYLTTIGVKIDSAVVNDTKLIVWDVAGRDALSPINASYLVGAAGVILVGDGTRTETVTALESLWITVKDKIGEVPIAVAINKHDLPNWQIDSAAQNRFDQLGWPVFHTSAKEGEQVAEMFAELERRLQL